MNILVTGAAAGLGWHLTQTLVKRGHTVVALDVHDTALDNLQAALKNNGNIRLVLCDVGDAKEVAKAKLRLSDLPIEVIINNAGVGHYEEALKMDTKDWQRQIDINLTGPFLICQHFGPQVVAAKGKIINVGSRRAIVPGEKYAGYCASKFGLRGFSLCLAKELKKSGVEVSIIELGAMMTDFGNRLLERKERVAAGENILQPAGTAAYLVDIIEGKIAYQVEYLLKADSAGNPLTVDSLE